MPCKLPLTTARPHLAASLQGHSSGSDARGHRTHRPGAGRRRFLPPLIPSSSPDRNADANRRPLCHVCRHVGRLATHHWSTALLSASAGTACMRCMMWMQGKLDAAAGWPILEPISLPPSPRPEQGCPLRRWCSSWWGADLAASPSPASCQPAPCLGYARRARSAWRTTVEGATWCVLRALSCATPCCASSPPPPAARDGETASGA